MELQKFMRGGLDVSEAAIDSLWTPYADAQATVEALQADNRTYINERHENMKQLEELQQQVEALRRERDALKIGLNALRDAYDELESRHNDTTATLPATPTEEAT